MTFTEDPSVFFADFSEAATWKGSVPVTVIFDNAYQIAGGMVEGTNPVVVGKTSDFPAVAHGDAFVLRGVSYTVSGIEPDVTGALLTLQLEEV